MAREYNISKLTGTCCRCGQEVPPGDEIVATVVEADEELARQDYCPDCWSAETDGRDEPDDTVLGFWRTRVRRPEEKKKLLVDDEVLVSFFERLAEAEDPVKVNFRFVLALVLMRKKLLIYDRMTALDDGRDQWQMHFRKSETVHEVIDPHMDAEQVAEVSRHLGEIMETGL